jgi:hypothetical protein
VSALFSGPVAVSFPAGQLAGLTLPGSVFGWRDIADAPLAAELRLALRLVLAGAEAARAPLRFIARPEMFTHGAARAWLDARLGGATHHVALTDGLALRPLAGLSNHLFFYPRGNPEADQALRSLLLRAPELLEQLDGQVNGALSLRIGTHEVQPDPSWLRFASTPVLETAMVAPLVLRSGNPARSAQLTAAEAVPPAAAPPRDRPLHYIPLSPAALDDAGFMAEIARLAQRAAIHAAAELPVLGLPPAAQPDSALADRLEAVFRPLVTPSRVFARAPSWTLRLATEPPTAAELLGGRITLHPGTAFWRLGEDGYAAAETVEVAGSGNLAPFRALLAEWLGFEPALRRPAREAGRLAVAIGALP